jgi:hypothetical protein
MQKSTIYKIYGIALLTTSAMLLLFVFLNLHYDGSIWQTMQQSKSALTAEYCELDNLLTLLSTIYKYVFKLSLLFSWNDCCFNFIL